MQIFRYAEMGSIRMLWIICTNPAVSLPELHRIRSILGKDDLFVVVQDAFMTETAKLGDVVFPAAIWGEKTGCFTNADRTVHISHKAVEPPGEFKEVTRGRPCDYSGLTYAKLTGGSGIQWPCNDQYPNGKERLYEDGVFSTQASYCETWGHDLETGAAVTEEQFRAHDPAGRAVIKPAEYHPPKEEPDEGYPLWLTTGRDVYHFHTRTKTGRSPELRAAAPDAYVQISPEDAERHGIAEGDMVEVESRRGKVQAPARIGDILPGHVFVPFHYGYWDEPGDAADERDNGRRRAEYARAANELTITAWDPVSKQPHFKYAAVKIKKV
jgi:anaerobic selenocysteine-containing dehydrogenase